MNRYTGKRLAITIGLISILIMGFCLWVSLRFYQFRVKQRPPEPIAYGDFPQEPVWIYLAPDQVTSTPLVQGSRLVIRSINAICAVNLRNGQELWCSASPGESPLNTNPKSTEELLVVPENDSNVAVFSGETGQLLWRAYSGQEGIKNPRNYWIEAIAHEGDLLFVARNNHNLTAYDLNTGSINWIVELPTRIIPYLATESQSLYVAYGERLSAFEIGKGNPLWDKDIDSLLGPILASDGILYVSIHFGEESLIALDLNSMEELWAIKSSDLSEDDLRYLVVDGGTIFASGKKLIAIDKYTGELLCSSKGTGYLERPAVLKDLVYVRDIGTTLYAFRADNCKETGRLLVRMNTPMKHEPERGPVVAGDLLIVPFGDNRVFAYRP